MAPLKLGVHDGGQVLVGSPVRFDFQLEVQPAIFVSGLGS
jgi:hypothetical protein